MKRKSPKEKNTAPQWVIFGAGRLGRTFLNTIASRLGFETTLVVAGVRTSNNISAEYNQRRDRKQGYKVTAFLPGEEPQTETLSNYVFRDLKDESLARTIADPATTVVSTSVGLGNLETLVPILHHAITLRAGNGKNGRLLILSCENGRSPDGLTAAQKLSQLVEDSLDGALLKYFHDYVDIPQVVVDCVVPDIDDPYNLKRGWGSLFVEDMPSSQAVFQKSDLVKLTSDLESTHVRKLYGFNSLHCYLSVIGRFSGLRHVHEVCGHRELKSSVEKLQESLTVAVQNNVKRRGGRFFTNADIGEYCSMALRRMSSETPPDRVDRILPKLQDESPYLTDGRIFGPVFDLGLNTHPERQRLLVKAVSLCLYTIFTQRSGLKNAPSTQSEEGAMRAFVTRALLDKPESAGNYPILDAIVDDLSYLRKVELGSHRFEWTPEILDEFFEHEASPSKGAPESLDELDLRCVVFDLDEALISSESLLYQVTRDMVHEYATAANKTLTHEDYAECVGMSEREFFENHMIPRFGIRKHKMGFSH